MIDRTHPLPVRRQCQLLKLARSTAYYHPTPVSETALTLMRRIDEHHLRYPFAGARMLRDLLRHEGQTVGRRHVATLMRRMGLEALYRKPSLSRRQPGHQIYPYLLRDLAISRPNHVWAADITYIPMRRGFVYLSRFSTGRVAGCWPGGSPPRSRPISVWTRCRTPWAAMARQQSSIPIKDANLPATSSPGSSRTTASRSAWTEKGAGEITCSSSDCGRALLISQKYRRHSGV